jgi:hypothetical protein
MGGGYMLPTNGTGQFAANILKYRARSRLQAFTTCPVRPGAASSVRSV